LANVRDGRLDRWLNRRLSWRLSLALARHPAVTPNQISLAAIAVGVAGALLVAVGGYWTRLAGLAVIQLASVLDCVDGEVARLTGRESRIGEWLDIAGDTIAHAALFVAIGVAVAADGGAHAVALGAVLATGALASFACVTYAERTEAARRRAGGALNRAIDVLVAALSTRDFHAVVFVFAAASRLDLFLVGAAVGAHVWWIALLVLLVLAGRAARSAVDGDGGGTAGGGAGTGVRGSAAGGHGGNTGHGRGRPAPRAGTPGRRGDSLRTRRAARGDVCVTRVATARASLRGAGGIGLEDIAGVTAASTPSPTKPKKRRRSMSRRKRAPLGNRARDARVTMGEGGHT
jgi:phosphatidylglycerophosphate synthase